MTREEIKKEIDDEVISVLKNLERRITEDIINDPKAIEFDKLSVAELSQISYENGVIVGLMKALHYIKDEEIITLESFSIED